MSVLDCDRRGCDNVMCDLISRDHKYYICDECFEALVALGPKIDLVEFMEGDWDVVDKEASRAYWSKIFIKR